MIYVYKMISNFRQMNFPSKKALLLILYFFCNYYIAIAGSFDWNAAGPLASVNGMGITLIDVLKVCGGDEAKLPYMYEGKALQEQIYTLRLLTLEELIKQKMVFNEFLSNGYQFPLGFMQNHLDKIAVANNLNCMAQLKKMIIKRGESFADFKTRAYERVAVNSLIYKECYKNIFITPKTIYEYYERHIARFTIPEQIELQVLELKRNGIHRKKINEFVDKLKYDLRNGSEKVFKESVLMYSEGPANQVGGNIGWIYENKLRIDFKTALAGADRGDIVGPVKDSKAYYFFRINNKKKSRIESYLEAKSEIKHTLTVKKRRNEYDEYIRKLRKKYSVKYYI
jgi:peptidyl-prolyl cis-trans isomerase SurA